MIRKINKTGHRGQTALILILLTAVGLIFLAITLNWGRIAQTKTMVTIAADQAAALLASDVASYGEMQKQTYLKNHNQISSLSQIVMCLIAVSVAIICLVITITTAGGGSAIWAVFAVVLAAAAVIMAIVNLVMQITSITPGEQKLWNSLQKSEPIQQQFYEGGLAQALESTVTDQVNVTDYFDLNTNGLFGMNWETSAGNPNDTIGRFAFFYTDRLRMLGGAGGAGGGGGGGGGGGAVSSSAVGVFVNQLGELINGETCGQNAMDNIQNSSIPLNTSCPSTTCVGETCTSDCLSCMGGSGGACTGGIWVSNYSDPACQMIAPNTISLSDPCSPNSDPTSATYTPYCDPCCQPLGVLNPNYDSSANPPNHLQPQYKSLRPSSCSEPANFPALCVTNPNDSTCVCNTNPTDPRCVPTQCTSASNPYGSSYPYIYDPSYQNYTSGISFLDQFGRDQQQMVGAGTPPLTTMTAQGSSSNGVYFPNGIYPFFWLMKDYSPEVDKIDQTNLQAPQVHWCAAGSGVGTPPAGYAAPSAITLTAFSDLTRLGVAPYTLPYACSGKDCCVGYLPSGMSGGTSAATSPAITVTISALGLTFTNFTINGSTVVVNVQAGDPLQFSVIVTENGGGTITSVSFGDAIPATLAGGIWSATYTIPVGTPIGSREVVATATDSNGNTGTSNSITINIIAPPPPSTGTGTGTGTVTST